MATTAVARALPGESTGRPTIFAVLRPGSKRNDVTAVIGIPENACDNVLLAVTNSA